ncbi:DUF4174 domain-containing protein [uncultured Methylobacterium sp.]|uniref:DUF4174 domain-containing protein n=1 Tax=uncultured Methylobacterium sp. TaxID=157278 RepID=UPI0035CBA6B9
MKTGLAAGAAAGLVAAGLAVAAHADPLTPYRWKSRLLVLAAPDAGDRRLAAQRQALAASRTAMTERDLVVLDAVGTDERAVSLRRAVGLATDAFRAVLVGKDGGVKISSPEPIPAQRLASTIDAMPMRREEMAPRP